MNLIDMRQQGHGPPPSYELPGFDYDVAIPTLEGDLMLGDAECLGEDVRGTPEEELAGGLDKPWWLGGRDAPSEREMERWFNASLALVVGD